MHSVRKSLNNRAGQLRPVAFSLLALAAGQLAFGQAAAPAADDKTNPPAETPVEKTSAKKADDSVVLFNTGSGLKYLEAYSTRYPRSAGGEQDKLGGLITPR